MSNKIDFSHKIKSSFEGPSSSYYTAINRFDEILKNKLGVKTQATAAATSAMFSLSGTALSMSGIFDDVTLKSGASAADIDAKLKGTAMEGLGESFVNAESKYGVNAWFLTSLAIHESGYGSSAIAQEKNNLFGFQAYDSSPYASAAKFSTKADSVDYVAKYLSESYLTPGGTYYNGVSIDSIGKRYATDTAWAEKVKKHMATLLQA